MRFASRGWPSALRSAASRAALLLACTCALACSRTTRNGQGNQGSERCESDCGGAPNTSAGGGPANGGARAGAPVGGSPVSILCPGSAVTCLDSERAQLCATNGTATTIVCRDALAEQGIVSNGCSSTGAGEGCTVDAFLDPECEAGTAPFAVCQALPEGKLLNAYVACFQGLENAATAVPCYRDFARGQAGNVDCAAARAACDAL